MGSLSSRDESEVQRSAIDASRRSSGSLLAPPNLVARYADPNPGTPHSLEYCFHLLGDVQGKEVLDLGCGAGENTLLLASRGARVTSVDISPDLIEIARERLAVNNLTASLRVASAYDTGMPDGSVDVVFCAAILHHLEAEKAHGEVLRVLKPGGLLILEEPVRDSRFYGFLRGLIPHSSHDNSEFERPLTKQEMDSFSAGFQCEAKRRFRLPFVALARMAGYWKRSVYLADRWALRNIPALEHFATVEVRKLRRG